MKAEAPGPKSRHREIALGGAGFVGAFLLTLLWPSGPGVQQPIQYNHQKHLDAGMECSNCHTLYSTTPWAGLPTIEMCSLCHQEPSTGTAAEAQVVEFVQKSENPRWQQVNVQKRRIFVPELGRYLTGALRLEAGGVACEVVDGPRALAAPRDRALLEWRVRCPSAGDLVIASDLLREVAPSHLHFARLREAFLLY